MTFIFSVVIYDTWGRHWAGPEIEEINIKFFNCTFSNTSRNSVQGLNIQQAMMSDQDIIRIAAEEAARQGTSLEDLAGIEWIEQDDGDFKPARELGGDELLAVAVEKLGDDGRSFEIEPA